MAFSDIPALPPLNFDDEQPVIGETTEFVRKWQQEQTELQAWSLIASAFSVAANQLSNELSRDDVMQARLKGQITFQTKAQMDVYGAPPSAGSETSELATVWGDTGIDSAGVTLSGVYGWSVSSAKWIMVQPYTKGLQGLPGKSAYQAYLDAGYQGSEAQWRNSIKGAKGDQGLPGEITIGDAATGVLVSRVEDVEAELLSHVAMYIFVADYHISGTDMQPALLAAAQASYTQKKPLVLQGNYGVENQVTWAGTSVPHSVICYGGSITATAAMTNVLYLENQHANKPFPGKTTWHGWLIVDGSTLADNAVQIKGCQSLSASIIGINAKLDGIWLNANAGFGIYDNHLELIGFQNGQDGVSLKSADAFRRINGNVFAISAFYNRRHGIYSDGAQNTMHIRCEKNASAGTRIINCDSNIITGYSEHNGDGTYTALYGDTNWALNPGATTAVDKPFDLDADARGVVVDGRHIGYPVFAGGVMPYDTQMMVFGRVYTNRWIIEREHSTTDAGQYVPGVVVKKNGDRYMVSTDRGARYNQYKTGARNQLITVSGSSNITSFGSSTLQNLVNGNLTANEANAWAMATSGVDATGEWIDFAFQGGTPILGSAFITNASNLGGSWKAQVSVNGGSSYTDVTSAIAWAPNMTWSFASNNLACTNFRILGTSGVMGFPFVPEIHFTSGTIPAANMTISPALSDGSTKQEWWLLDRPAEVDVALAAATLSVIKSHLPPMVGPNAGAGARVVAKNIVGTNGQLTYAVFETGYVKSGASNVLQWNWVSGRVLS